MDNYGWQREIQKVNDMREPKEIILEHLPDTGDKPGTIVAEDWTTIPKNTCRRCKKPLTKYSEVYFEWVPGEYKVKYCYDNSYCEACAKFCSGRKHKGYRPTRVAYMTHDVQGRETLYLEDGSIIEEGDIPQNE